MNMVRMFTVKPSLPKRLGGLEALAYNMFWSWNSEYIDLFKRIDPNLWEVCGHNPVKLLGTVSQARLEDLSHDDGFVYHLEKATEDIKEQLEAPTWFEKVYSNKTKPLIAYFSAEFGLHESLPIYSGGLGILAGDHLKSASDLGIPLIGIGLLYQKGYFQQYLNSDGWQQEHYVQNDFYNMAVKPVRKKSGLSLKIKVPFPGRSVSAKVWQVQVGRIALYLLDTNVPENSTEDRAITSSLYGGAEEMRICQEIILGIGGLKALEAMKIEPTVCHMNEGHAAFMALERVRKMQKSKKMTFDEALEATRSSNVFTVHTPVAAGCDEFKPELMDKYFGHYHGKLGLNRKDFLGLGRVNADNDDEAFSMPVLAIRTSSYRNGVSQLHGEVSQKMWGKLWPGLPTEEVPIQSITNGVHVKTWLSPEMNDLYERYLGSNWSGESIDKSVWQNIENIPDEEFWRIHQRCKERLVGFARKRLKAQMLRRGSYHTELGWAEEALDPEALTIGFARRFATYKRGNLLLREPERLRKLLNDPQRPVQLVFAGKAHPRDTEGKEIIRQIVHFAKKHGIRRRIVFIENYDINVARYLVQGVDVWLNNPRRPLEASGTSGMKAAVNGVLNLSTLDGWWCEGYTPEGGWVIGSGEEYDDAGYQDAVESQALYNLLENEVVPLFYAKSNDRLRRQWIKRMKNTIKWCAPRFNTNRMVADYARKFYAPAAERWRHLTAEAMTRARALSMWRTNTKNAWQDLSIDNINVQVDDGDKVHQLNGKQPQLAVGAQLRVEAEVKLGRLDAGDVSVQIYHGIVDSAGKIENGEVAPMNCQSNGENGDASVFAGAIPCTMSGQHGFAVRIMPKHDDLNEPYEPGMILWEGNGQD